VLRKGNYSATTAIPTNATVNCGKAADKYVNDLAINSAGQVFIVI
jgi:hypothetical protein